MPYRITNSSGSQITIADNGIDNTYSIGLIGKNTSAYGLTLNQNMYRMMETFANSSPPAGAVPGQLWFDTSAGSKLLRVYNGTGWKIPGNMATGTSGPASPAVGEMWFDTANNIFKVWSGSTWLSVGPLPSPLPNAYTLPNVAGSNLQVLTTDGAGTTSWTAVVNSVAVSGAGISRSAANGNITLTLASNSTNNPNTLVFRDNSGNFAANTITANQFNGPVVATNGSFSGNVTGTWAGNAIPLTAGGTGTSLTMSTGGIVYSGASALAILSGVAEAGRLLLSGNSAAPTWSSYTMTLGGAMATGGAVTFSGAYGFTATLSGTTSVTFPTSGTLATTSSKLSAFAATTSSELAGVISDETGSGALVFATSPTLITPTLGVASATSISTSTYTASGSLAIKPGANATTSIQLQNATGTSVLNVDTTNSRIGIGTTSPSYKLDVAGDINLSLGSVIRLNGALGTTGQVLQSNGTAIVWGTVATGSTPTLPGGAGGGELQYNSSGSFAGLALATITGSSTSARFLLKEGSSQSTNELFGVYDNAGSVARLVVKSGLVGISTSSPNTKLEILDATARTTFTGSTVGTVLLNHSGGNSNFTSLDFANSSSSSGIAQSRIASLQTSGGSYLYFGTSNNYATGITNTAMIIDYTGKVGIGATPSYKLDVAGDINLSSGSVLRLNGTLGTSGQVLQSTGSALTWASVTTVAGSGSGEIQFNSSGAFSGLSLATITGSSSSVRFLLKEGSAQSTNELFGIYDNAGTTPRLVVKNGKIGIAVASPAYMLDISGDVNLSSTSALRINGSIGLNNQVIKSTGSALSWVDLPAASGAGSGELQINSGGAFASIANATLTGSTSSLRLLLKAGSAQATNELFGIYDNAGTTPYLTVKSAKVGIGTASPAYMLDVVGDINLSTGSVIRLSGALGTNNQVIKSNGTSLSWATVPTISGTGVGEVQYNTSGGLDSSTLITIVGSSSSIRTLYKAGSAQSTNELFGIYNNAGTTPYFVVQNAKIGIGTSTPAYMLDVVGDINLSSTSVIRLNGSLGTNNQVIKSTGSALSWVTLPAVSGAGSGELQINSSGSFASIANATLTGSTSTLRFLLKEGSAQSTNELFGIYDNAGSVARFVVKNAKIGIGIASPTDVLHVAGATTLGTSAATLGGTGYNLVVGGTNTKTSSSDSTNLALLSNDALASNPLMMKLSLVGNATAGSRYAVIEALEYGTSTYRTLCLNPNGSTVGIALTTIDTNAKLHVGGNILTTGKIYGSGTSYRLVLPVGTNYYAT